MSKLKQLPPHPLQSKAWGEFRKKTSVEVISVAPNFQMTIHKLPVLRWTVGYLPKCKLPDEKIVRQLIKIGKEKRCIFIKLEPNIIKTQNSKLKTQNYNLNVKTFNIKESPHPLFTKYTFQIDLTKSEGELLRQMKAKTRYNIRLAEKHGVKVIEDNSDKAFETYLKLSKETWKRQKFYSHNENYHRLMWETLKPAGIAHLLMAYYQPLATPPHPASPAGRQQAGSYRIPLAAWMLFLYKEVLYYPYGGSSNKKRNLMASNLLMWEAMRWGKKHGAKLFDLWGCLGHHPDKTDPWYGFHRFKEGYEGKLVEFIGSYDLILNPYLYKIYNLAYPLRQNFLKRSKSHAAA